MESPLVVILDILGQALVVAYLFLDGSVEPLKITARLGVSGGFLQLGSHDTLQLGRNYGFIGSIFPTI